MIVYREEIDGLRGIAVVSVILYHAGFQTFFSGGYVGVDIFFVISGYLITSIIQKECEEDTFSLMNFYERRCRRILPALFFILFLSSIFAYYYMLPYQLKEFGESLISIVCLSSNIYFWWKDDGYFSRVSELNPLVHTWSLAVEEQFYFIFPLLCYLFIKKKLFFILILICFGIISLFLSQWGGYLELMSFNQFHMFFQHRYASFYLPVGRIWELLLGVFVAFYLRIDNSTKEFSFKSSQLLSLFGLVLIIISVVFFDAHYIPPFPNLYTLIPTCGTTLILIFGEKTTFVGYLLSRNLLRWIGLISYSAYLWHQPLFVFIRLQSIRTPQISTIIKIVSVIFPLSLFSYLFIEQPFRNKKRFSQKKIFAIAGLVTVVMLIIALVLIQTANYRSSLLDKVEDIEDLEDTYLSDLQKYGNDDYVLRAFDAIAYRKQEFSNRTSTLNRRIVLIGDSFAQDFYNIITVGKRLVNYEICVYYVHFYCQIYLGSEDRSKLIQLNYIPFCANAHDIKYALPLIRQANIIILAGRWMEWSAQRLPTTLKLLNLTKNQQVFVVGGKSFGSIDLDLYIDKPRKYRIQQYQYPLIEEAKINDLLEKTIDKSIFVNIAKMICTGVNRTCPLFTPNGKLISYDGMHLTKYGARYIWDIIFNNKPLNKLQQIL